MRRTIILCYLFIGFFVVIDVICIYTIINLRQSLAVKNNNLANSERVLMKNKLEKERTINYYSDMQSVPQIQFDDSQLYKTASGKRSFDKSTNFIVFIDPQNGFDLGLLDRLVELLESSEIEREISIVIEGSINTDLSSYSNLINLGYDIFLISALPLQFSDILICRYSSTEHLYNYFILNSYTFSALNGYISVESKI